MFSTLLAVTVAAAPVPKTVHEGKIAVFINHPAFKLLVLSPSGQLEKTIDLTAIPDHAYAVRLSRNGQSALITCSSDETIPVRNPRPFTFSGYLVDLADNNKPRKLIEKQISFSWAFNRDGSKVYGSSIDIEKYAKQGPNDPAEHKSWCLDIKTGKSVPFDLPSSHSLVDLTADDETALTATMDKDRVRSAITPVKTGKPTVLTGHTFNPYGISPDGKKILARDLDDASAKPRRGEDRTIVYDLDSRSKRAIDMPEGAVKRSAFSFGADGKRICYIAVYHSPFGGPKGSLSYKLFTASIDGTNPKMIYESKGDEELSDCDWR